METSVLAVIPTVIEHNRRYRLFDQLWHEPLVSTVLLVDNGNCFGIPPKKHHQWSKMEHVRPGCNLNWLASNNLGAAIALERGFSHVCFMNDDIHLSRPNFFEGLMKTFQVYPDAGLVVPRYNGQFGDRAHCGQSERQWSPEDTETQVGWVDGTCMLLPTSTIRSVGFLDPGFRAPGWGADVDYSHRVTKAGLKLFVSHRAMVWHYRGHGGLSATQVYENRKKWVSKGLEQAQSDLEAKYGPEWRSILPIPADAYDG